MTNYIHNYIQGPFFGLKKMAETLDLQGFPLWCGKQDLKKQIPRKPQENGGITIKETQENQRFCKSGIMPINARWRIGWRMRWRMTTYHLCCFIQGKLCEKGRPLITNAFDRRIFFALNFPVISFIVYWVIRKR